MDTKREMFRHCLATLAYRAAKVLRDAPESFGEYRSSETSRTPGEILAHLGDLIDWALSIARGKQVWEEKPTVDWQSSAARFFNALEEFDKLLASDQALAAPEEKLFQGPVADALTHVGQIAMLRRMAGNPIRGENYFKADIASGRVGAEQNPARVEFD